MTVYTLDPDGSDYYHSFEQRSVFKLQDILKERKITAQELYRSCDVDNDGEVTKDPNILRLMAWKEDGKLWFYKYITQYKKQN